MGLIDVLFGRPLASSEDEGQRISPQQGIPTFGLDALSSAAYGPEAALTILLPLGLLGVRYIVPLTAAIIGLLVIVYSVIGRRLRLIRWAEDLIPSRGRIWGAGRECWRAQL